MGRKKNLFRKIAIPSPTLGSPTSKSPVNHSKQEQCCDLSELTIWPFLFLWP